jgi:hypothetical protein
MALISEWMEQCGKKVLDNAGILREASSRQQCKKNSLAAAVAQKETATNARTCAFMPTKLFVP